MSKCPLKMSTAWPTCARINTSTLPIGIIVSQTPIRRNRNSIAVQYYLNSAANSALLQLSGQFATIATRSQFGIILLTNRIG